MAKIYSAYGEKKELKANEAGNRLEPICKEVLDEKGKFTGIEPTGEYTDTYKKIQSYKEETDIHTILEKYANGDISVLHARTGKYIDVSAIPNNFNDLMAAYRTAQQTIEKANEIMQNAKIENQQDTINGTNKEETNDESKQ